MKKIIIAIISVFCLFSLIGCGNSEKKEIEESVLATDDVLKGKVKIPNTYFKTKQEVELLFKAADLNVEFVVSNFDEKATINNRFLKKEECDQLNSDQPAVTYYGDDEVGDKYGFYADKGATIIVGYSDHDFDGRNGDTSTESSEKKEATNSNSSSSKNKNDKETISNSEPIDYTKELTDLNTLYDSLIEKANGFNKNPKTYTITNFSKFQIEMNEILLRLNDLSEATNNGQDLTEEESANLYMSLMKKQNELNFALINVPKDFSE